MVKYWVQIFPVSQHSGPNMIPVLAPDLFYQIPSAVAPRSSRCCCVWEKGRSLSHCGFEVDLISPALCWLSKCLCRVCLWVEGEWWNKIWIRFFSIPGFLCCAFREIHKKLFLSGGVCPWALQIFQPSLAESCSCVALLVLNDRAAAPIHKEARLCFQTSVIYSPFHLFFWGCGLYLSKSSTLGAAEVGCSHVKQAQFSLWLQTARRRLFLSKWDLPVATVSFPEEEGFGMVVLKGISGAKCFLKCLGKSVCLPALFQ